MKVVQSKVLVIVSKDTMTQKIGNFSVPVNDFEKAKVVEVGEEVKSPLKKDDEILIYPNSGKSFTHEGVEYRVITLNEIIVIL